MKLLNLMLPFAVISSTTFAKEASSDIDLSANVGFTSNYIYRGMTQTKDSPAIQGGVDLGYKNFYIGAWGSNVEFGDGKNSLETDIYAGYKNEFEGIEYNIGAMQYIYANMSDEYNFAEVYFGLSKDFEKFGLSAKYSVGIKTNSLNPENYFEASTWIALPYKSKLTLGYGNFSNIGDNYSISIKKSFDKFDISLTYIDFNHDKNSALDEENIVAAVGFAF